MTPAPPPLPPPFLPDIALPPPPPRKEVEEREKGGSLTYLVMVGSRKVTLEIEDSTGTRI